MPARYSRFADDFHDLHGSHPRAHRRAEPVIEVEAIVRPAQTPVSDLAGKSVGWWVLAGVAGLFALMVAVVLILMAGAFVIFMAGALGLATGLEAIPETFVDFGLR